VLFIEPIWLSILIPIFSALILLIASLAVRHWHRARFDKAAFLSTAGFALAFFTGGALFAAVLLAFVLFTHWIALAIERAADRRNRDAPPSSGPAPVWLVVAVGLHLAMVAAISRAGVVTGPLQDVGGAIVPFGVSYFAFHGISYVVDVYRRRAAAERSRWQLAVHLLLLPQIVGGPLAYEGVARQLARRWPSISDYSYGLRRLLIGVWKVFVIAHLAGTQADAAFAPRPGELSAFQAWWGLVSFTLQMYYGFSGYADMGIGLGRMLGIRLPENFRWPYVGETVREFWRRWHIGLSAWFHEYADLSLDADRVPPPSAGREALVVLLCGIWYGVGWTFVCWGLYHAALIALERAGVEAAVKRLPAPLRHAYLIGAVMVGWVVLRSGTLGGALLFLQALAGLNASPLRARPTIAIELWLVLAAGVIGCAPLFPAIRRWTVVIDALIVSLLMMLFAAVLFAWRCGWIIATPVLRWWRGSPMRAGRLPPYVCFGIAVLAMVAGVPWPGLANGRPLFRF
jgi:alginate O-acetyltransferase complex protein AlgI